MKRFILIISIIAAALITASSVHAAVMVNVVKARTTYDITGYTGAGLAPGANTLATGQIDSDNVRVGGFSDGDTDFGDTNTTGDFARGASTGGVTDAGLYAFNNGNTTFGVQPTDLEWNDSTSYVDVLFENNTGRYLNNISVEGNLWYLNNGDKSSEIKLELSRDGTSFLAIGSIISPESAAANRWNSTFVIKDHTFFTNPLAPNEQFFVRLSGSEISGTGDHDEFGFSNLTVILRNQSVPEPRTIGFLAVGMLGARYVRERRKKYGYHDSDAAKRLKSIQNKMKRKGHKPSLSADY
jgi:hypothetical protein